MPTALFPAYTAAPVPVLAATPWQRLGIEHLWGWLVLLAVAAAGLGFIKHQFHRWENRTRRQRVMSLPLRLRLRRGFGQGWANLFELHEGYGLRRPRKDASRLAPSVNPKKAPGTHYATRLGYGRWFRRIWAPLEETVMYIAPPRAGKSGEVANQILNAPGPVLSTSVRGDLVDLTAQLRSQLGPVWVFDPEDTLGSCPWSKVVWSPINGCQRSIVASHRAAFMVEAVQNHGVTDKSFWENAAARVLRALLHAAALGEYTMADVHRWATTADETPARVLRSEPNADQAWASVVENYVRMETSAEATQKSIGETLANVLDFMSHPGIAATVSQPPSQSVFDVEAMLRQRGALYLIASDNENSLVAPVFAALVAEVRDRALALAQRSPGRRLDPRLDMALDEVPNICPIPMAKWAATAAGSGINMKFAIQSPSQLRQVWGQDNARTIWNLATSKVIWGGLQDPDDMETISKMIGEDDFWYEPAHYGADGKRHREREWRRERIIRPEEVRRLPRRCAIVITRGWQPTLIRTRPAWMRKSVKNALKYPIPAPAAAAEQPAAPSTPAPSTQPEPALEPATLSDADVAALLAGEVTPQQATNQPNTSQNTEETDTHALPKDALTSLLAGEGPHNHLSQDNDGWGPHPPWTRDDDTQPRGDEQ